jgi:hypothetical protein
MAMEESILNYFYIEICVLPILMTLAWKYGYGCLCFKTISIVSFYLPYSYCRRGRMAMEESIFKLFLYRIMDITYSYDISIYRT